MSGKVKVVLWYIHLWDQQPQEGRWAPGLYSSGAWYHLPVREVMKQRSYYVICANSCMRRSTQLPRGGLRWSRFTVTFTLFQYMLHRSWHKHSTDTSQPPLMNSHNVINLTIVWYIKLDAKCDQQVMVDCWQHMRCRLMCRGKIFEVQSFHKSSREK